jgi:hypothetical protein
MAYRRHDGPPSVVKRRVKRVGEKSEWSRRRMLRDIREILGGVVKIIRAAFH